jgi:phenol hydroxylase P1 protein
MAYEIRQNVIDPIRVGYQWVATRIGRPANRYEEGSIEVQQQENFHYRPLWDPDHEIFDPSYSVLQLTDWYSFLDPRQYYYYTYNQARTRAAEALASAQQYAEQAGAFEALDPRWHTLLVELFGPLRHHEYGAHLIMAQVSRFSYGTTIEQAAIFSSFDHLGNAQALTKVLLKLEGGQANLAQARRAWLEGEAQQPLRRYVENVLARGDWGEQWTALNVVLNTWVYPAVYRYGETLGRKTGLGMVGTTLRYLDDWYRDDRTWTERLLEVFANDPGHGAHNRAVLAEFVERWRPQAEAVLMALLPQFGAVGGTVDEGLALAQAEFESLLARLTPSQ